MTAPTSASLPGESRTFPLAVLRELCSRSPRDKVSLGAAYMDRVCPDWFRRVDAGVLDLEDPWTCIGGQTFGNYRNLPLLAPALDSGDCEGSRLIACAFGFLSSPTPGEEDDPGDPGDQPELELAWLSEISERLHVQALNDLREAVSAVPVPALATVAP